MLTRLRSLLGRGRRRLVDSWHHRRLRSLAAQADYRNSPDYLDQQLRRTLSKRGASSLTHAHARLIVEQLERIRPPEATGPVLCIGCRNTDELEFLRSHGYREVIGIDLYSEDPSILVMDMHRMTFEDGRFGLIYSAHSLEHALEPKKVAAEIARVARPEALVAIEVPVDYPVGGADLHDYGSPEGVHTLFGDSLGEVFVREKHRPQTSENPMGTSVARTIFSIRKSAT